MTENTPTLPFADMALRYVESGSGSPLPIPARQKFPPPAGFTGRNGIRPTAEQVELWCELEPASNVAVRLAEGVITLDVDHHEDKTGWDSIEVLAAIHGSLPIVWRSTARGSDDPSGNYWYTVPSGFDPRQWRESHLGDRVELITPWHRYVVVSDSIHPNGSRYEWLVGDEKADDIPQLSALPTLPVQWAKHLEGSCKCFIEERTRLATARSFAGTGARKCAMSLLNTKHDELAQAPKGHRNNLLNAHAFSLYLHQVLHERLLSEGEVTGAMTNAAMGAGLDADEIGRTLESARIGALGEYRGGIA